MVTVMKEKFIKPSQVAALRAQTSAASQNAARDSTWTAALGLAANASLWIAVFAGLFYCQGRAYRDSYLIIHGLYPPMFPWDHGDMVYFGVNIGFSNLLSAIIFPAISASYLIALLILARRRWKKWRGPEAGSKEAKVKTSQRTPMKLTTSQLAIVSFLLLVLAALIFMFIYFIMTTVAASHGRAKAEQEIKRQDSCNFNRMDPQDFIPVRVERLVQGEHERYDGFLITCSAANCGVRSAVTGHAQVIPRDGILRFDTVDIADAYLPAR
ncbi:hypothetical protein CH72_5266 [Burkholderia ambifaria AMMD]|nr:hypothetical protein CH72_5266 [Burkholderia ambifaria AMMD]